MPRVHRKLPELTEQEEARFWNKVNKAEGQGPNGDCWEWTGRRKTGRWGGYGEFQLRQGRGQERIRLIASRVAFFLQTGIDPLELGVLHRCDNPPCCRGKHLFSGTDRDNMADAKAKGRLSTGDRHYSKVRPEAVARGPRNGNYTCPERRATGDRHRSRTHPESVARGSAHRNARLTEDDIVAIRQSAQSGHLLARRYRVSEATISLIRRRKSWKHV